MNDANALSSDGKDPQLSLTFHYKGASSSFLLPLTRFTHANVVTLYEQWLKEKELVAPNGRYGLQYEDSEKEIVTITTAADFRESGRVLLRPSVPLQSSTHTTEYATIDYDIVPIERYGNRSKEVTSWKALCRENEQFKDALEMTLVDLYEASLQLQGAIQTVQSVLQDNWKEQKKGQLIQPETMTLMTAVTQTPTKEQYHTEAQTVPINSAVRMTQTNAIDNTASTTETQTHMIEQVSIQTQISPFATIERTREIQGRGEEGREEGEVEGKDKGEEATEEIQQKQQQEEQTKWVMPLLDPNETKEEKAKKPQWVEKFHSILEIFPTATYASIEPLLEKHNGNLDLVLNELMEIMQ